MSSILMIEKKNINNVKTMEFFAILNQYFKTQNFRIIDAVDLIIYLSKTNITPGKMKVFTDTIRNTINYKLSVKQILISNNMTKI